MIRTPDADPSTTAGQRYPLIFGQDYQYPVYEHRQAGYLQEVNRLSQEEKPWRAFARDIEARVAELTRADVRHLGQGEALDWHGWIQRVEQLQAIIAAASLAQGNNTVLLAARGRLATALAEVSTMLADLEVTPPAEAPADVTGYTAKEIWDSASGMFSGPLLTTIASLAKGMHLPAESTRWALAELHKAGRIRLFRYPSTATRTGPPARSTTRPAVTWCSSARRRRTTNASGPRPSLTCVGRQ
ncbi:hypothetical protein AB0M95_34030 [Sphaerisporangium sp. NPDC051017]|uniref:hypothetical protein n=1 Tax=Sphaerisporangium sp. NPDC051017 TaxID=3154636 RepID=UPI003418EEF0